LLFINAAKVSTVGTKVRYLKNGTGKKTTENQESETVH